MNTAKVLSLLAILLSLSAGSALAQTGRIAGTVTDASTGEPLPGVNVFIVDTTIGASTDLDGYYEIDGLSPDLYSVQASFIGYTTQIVEDVNVAADQTTALDFMLEPSALGLDEVVVVGYGTQQRRHLTGAVGSVQMDEELSSRPVVDFGQAMVGKSAGVQVLDPSGRPGESSRIQIRGINSISAGSEPLVVIDGVPLPSFDLNTLNPDDIESIDILKDAASAAIYGSRGANGVVLVTTKDGVPGVPRVTFNYGYTSQNVVRTMDMMNAAEYAQAAIDAAQIAWIRTGGDPNAPNTVEARGELKYTWPEALEHPETLPNVDYQDLIYRTAPMHQADLSFSGGTENSTYYVSAGITNQKGIIITTDYQKYTLNMKANTRLKEWLAVGGMMNTAYDDESVINSHTRRANQYPPIYAVYGEDGHLGGPQNHPGFEDYNAILFRPYHGHPYHRIGEDDDRQSFNTIGNVYAELGLWRELKLRSSVNAFYRRGDRGYYRNADTNLGPNDLRPASFYSSMNRSLSYTFENLLLYTAGWRNHQFDAVAGYEFNHSKYYFMEAERRDYDNDLVRYLSAGNTIDEADDNAYENALISMFGRLNYNYRGKYLASATFRRDGSSRFGPDNKWGNFPSLSAGWRVSEEPFMADVGFLSNLMIRASYGFTGNNRFSDYRWISTMSQARVAFGDELATSYYPSSVQNPDLQWERTQQTNLGLEFGFLDDRIMLEADLYRSESNDLLLNVPVPSTSGFTSVFRNIGALENKGVELNLHTRNLTTSDFVWTSQATMAANRAEITKLGPDDAPMIFSEVNMGMINKIGEAPFSFYAYDYLGVYRNQAEIDADGLIYPFEVKPGMGRHRDVNGDGRITSDDRTIIGNGQPDFTWALNNTFRYKRLDFSFLLHGSVGGEVYDANWRRSMFYHEGRNYLAEANRRWRSEEEPGDGYIHALTVDVAETLERDASSYWVMDGTYTRLKAVTLGFTLPPRYAQRAGIGDVRIYLNGTNLLTFQNTTTIDPENMESGPTDAARVGIQHSPYPSAKTVTAGVNLTF